MVETYFSKETQCTDILAKHADSGRKAQTKMTTPGEIAEDILRQSTHDWQLCIAFRSWILLRTNLKPNLTLHTG